jgi:predicted  nucleic acid-binding Zn-ribbon protein
VSEGSLARLLTVQDLDTSITQLEHRRVALAERAGLIALQSELASLAADDTALQTRRLELDAAQNVLEGQLATLNERRSGIEQRMYAARGSSTRDLQAMDEEVRHLTQRGAELEEQELVIMVDLDPVNAALSELAARMSPLKEKADALAAEVAVGQSDIDVELATARAARAAEAAELPAALTERYEALRTRLKGTGAARLIGNRCDGCHLNLSSVEVERIRSAPPDTVATCEQCGRILVPV